MFVMQEVTNLVTWNFFPSAQLQASWDVTAHAQKP